MIRSDQIFIRTIGSEILVVPPLTSVECVCDSSSHVQQQTCSIFNDWLSCGEAGGCICNLHYISTHWVNPSIFLKKYNI